MRAGLRPVLRLRLVCSSNRPRFIQSEHATGNGNGGKAKNDISIFGQESNYNDLAVSQDESGGEGYRGEDFPRKHVSLGIFILT